MFRRYVQKFILVLMSSLCSLTLWASEPYILQVNGLKGQSLKNVKERLAILQEALGQLSNENIKDFLQRSPNEIREALQPFGYFKTMISATLVGHQVIFNITPGQAVILKEVSIVLTGPGKDNRVLQQFVKDFPIKPGQPLKINRYEAAKEKLFLLASEQGYMKAALDKKEIRINLKKDTADIIWEFNTGPQFYFGPVLFEKNAYSTSFLQRFIPFKSHEIFSSEKLIQFQQDMSNSRYFQQVEVQPNLNNSDNTSIPILVNAKPPKSQRYDIGLGYGTYTGPRLTLGSDFRRVTSTGQRFNMEMKLSTILSALSAKYFIPGNNPITEQYTVGGNIQYFSPKNGSSFSQSLTSSYIRNVKEWQNTVSLNVLNEKYRIEDKPIHQSQVIYPSWTVTRIKSDNPIYPRFGSMFTVTLQGANTEFLSKSNFFQGEVKTKTIVSPTKNSRLIMRGDLGYTVVDNLNQLPLTLRYFAGGLGSVRGYPFSGIGPGKYLEVGSVEIQHKIYGDWNGALFYDIGSASDTFNENFKRGQGLGIIYRSLIGPVQLYVGQALSKKDKPYSIEFSIGPDF